MMGTSAAAARRGEGSHVQVVRLYPDHMVRPRTGNTGIVLCIFAVCLHVTLACISTVGICNAFMYQQKSFDNPVFA